MITVCIGDSIVRGYPFMVEESWVRLLEQQNSDGAGRADPCHTGTGVPLLG